jgi:hypothetical protein
MPANVRLTLRRLRLLVCLPALAVGCSFAPPPTPQEFSTFWSTFRTATLGDNVDQVASMTRFPLEVRGPDDADPIVNEGRDSFDGVLAQVMNQDSGVLAEGETVRQYVQRTDDIGERNVEPDGHAARVGDFVFERVGDRWMLVRVYLAEVQ